MWNSKYFLITLTALVLGAASAQAAGEILQNADGSILYMTQYDAMKACPGGTRLPTIRELAEESQALGAKGILEVSQVNPDSVPAGYDKISAINPNRQKDEFYFNHEGYTRPDGDLGISWVWSSSVLSGDSFHGYLLNGVYGYVDYYNRDFSGYGNGGFAVHCVAGR